MKRRAAALVVFLLTLTATAGVTATALPLRGDKPNLLVILADDLGIECLSAYGGQSHQTPHLDRLAAQGMRFTHCFSNPYCSPSRASLLTGRYPFRNGLKEVLFSASQHADTYLRVDQPSFARQLKQAGYATALAGKWHLSLLHRHNTIRDFGFDQYVSWQIFRSDGVKSERYYEPHYIQNGGNISDRIKDRFGPDVSVEFLIDFIKASAARRQPFLAYYTSILPHFPWVPTPDSQDQPEALKTGDEVGDPRFFPDMVRYLDKQVGQLLRTLDEAGLANDTVVIFLADNGTDARLSNAWGDGKRIVGGKGTMTDRGTRVPLLVRWPQRIAPGSVCADLVDFSDFLPTICELAGAPLPAADLDGRSFAPQLLGRTGSPREWVHVQDKEARHVRNREYILTHRNELRPVVEIWEPEARPVQGQDPEKERAARKTLQAVFDTLGK
jgi:arylsulfatase A-like enzyme